MMVRASENRLGTSLGSLIDHILSSGQLSRQDYTYLTSTILSNHRVTTEERRVINRIFDSIKNGKLRIVD